MENDILSFDVCYNTNFNLTQGIIQGMIELKLKKEKIILKINMVIIYLQNIFDCVFSVA